jgi:hypothetical protein
VIAWTSAALLLLPYLLWTMFCLKYRIWTNDGTFDRILKRLRARLNAEGLLDLDTWFVDSTTVRASRAAAGTKKGL